MNNVFAYNRASKRARNIFFILSIIALLTAVTNDTFLSSLVKYINTVGMLSTILIFPYYTLRKNDFDGFTRWVMTTIILMTVIQGLRSILYPDLQLKGNLYLTLFGNEFCVLSLIISFFIYLSQSERTLIDLKSITFTFCFVGCICTLVFKSSIYFPAWVATAFFPYYKDKQKLIIIIVYVLMLYGAVFAEEAYRTDMAVLGVFMMTLMICKFHVSRKIIVLICYGMIIVPFAYLIITLLDPSSSIIQIVMEELFNRTSNSVLSNDTRTFLFVEMAEDLTTNDAWIWGKGARSGYFSQYFLKSTSGEGDHWYRLTSEVSVLHYLLRGGITFLICHYGLILYAVVKTLKYGKNRFVLSVAMLASGWIFISCFSFLHGFNIVFVGFFVMLGCCLSEKWLNRTDEEINNIFSVR